MVIQALDLDDLFLPPLPNHLFKRDNSAWIYNGVCINPMAKKARDRESIHYAAIYRFHPMFADSEFKVWSGGDESTEPATPEGGDIHVLGRGAVLIGMSERTTPQGGRAPRARLFAGGSDKIIALSSCRSSMP